MNTGDKMAKDYYQLISVENIERLENKIKANEYLFNFLKKRDIKTLAVIYLCRARENINTACGYECTPTSTYRVGKEDQLIAQILFDSCIEQARRRSKEIGDSTLQQRCDDLEKRLQQEKEENFASRLEY